MAQKHLDEEARVKTDRVDNKPDEEKTDSVMLVQAALPKRALIVADHEAGSR